MPARSARPPWRTPRARARPPEIADRQGVAPLIARLVVQLGRTLRELDRARLVTLLRGDGSHGEQRASGPGSVTQLLPDREALLEEPRRRLVVALARGQAPGRVQRTCAQLGRRRPSANERLVEPATPFGEIAAHPPELPERGRQPQAEAGLARVERPGERAAEVVALGVHAGQPRSL